MPLWALIAIALVVLFVARWIILGRQGMKNKPNIDALLEGGQLVPAIRGMLDYLIENPDISENERLEGIEEIDRIGKVLSRLLAKPGVDENSRIYVRLWVEFASNAYEFFKAAPFNLQDDQQRAQFNRLKQRDVELKEKSNRMIAANPQPSFWRIFFLGRVPVRSVD